MAVYMSTSRTDPVKRVCGGGWGGGGGGWGGEGLVRLMYMGDSSYGLNFDIGKKNEIQHYSQKEHFRMQIYTKFANFTGLYFPHFTTFRNQTLQFYSF